MDGKHLFTSILTFIFKCNIIDGCVCYSTATAGPPVPPVKPLKLQHLRLPADSCCSSESLVSPADAAKCPDSETITGQGERLQPSPADLRSCSPLEWESSNSANPITEHSREAQLTLCSYVERLKREGEKGKEEEEVAGDRSSYHHAIAALENTSEEEDEDAGKDEEKDKRRKKERSSFQRPVIETESMFRPAEFDSRLLPLENKPLEMAVLKRAKELVLSHNHHSLARHLLMADCQVYIHSLNLNITTVIYFSHGYILLCKVIIFRLPDFFLFID